MRWLHSGSAAHRIRTLESTSGTRAAPLMTIFPPRSIPFSGAPAQRRVLPLFRNSRSRSRISSGNKVRTYCSMTNYHPAFAVQTPVDDSIKDFVAKFYTTSDTPGKNTEWVDFFQDDATLVMEKKSATGKTDILKVREGMWEKVQAREHTVFKVFPATFEKTAAGEVELMLYGHVVYRLKGAESSEPAVDWAGYARLVKVGSEWKFAYYRVYIQR